MTDPAHDSELLALVDREKFYERMLRLVPDTAEWGVLRFIYFATAERLRMEIAKRIRGGA